MATLKPFQAWRPTEESVHQISSVPYDVINTQEAKQLSKDNKLSFLHVVRPEIDLPSVTSIYADEVYEKGRQNLNELLDSDHFLQESSPCYYIYELTMGDLKQCGIFACVSVKEYDDNTILKHEKTRPDKEDDRTKHIITQKAHAEPVMLAFKDTDSSITALMNNYKSNSKPLYDFETDDGVKHTIWRISEIDNIYSAFQDIKKIYVADGHHRCASASRAAKEFASQNPKHDGTEAYNFFPAVLFPTDQMEILPYNRIIFSLPDNFLDQVNTEYQLKENVAPKPPKKGMISMYINETWYGLTLKKPIAKDPVSNLDISLLQQQILQPMLGIKDQRTDPNIDFVGGIRGTDELVNLIDNGEASLAISLYPTSIEELLSVSDAGQLMPPKSTWFEPKLRSGLLIHTF